MACGRKNCAAVTDDKVITEVKCRRDSSQRVPQQRAAVLTLRSAKSCAIDLVNASTKLTDRQALHPEESRYRTRMCVSFSGDVLCGRNLAILRERGGAELASHGAGGRACQHDIRHHFLMRKLGSVHCLHQTKPGQHESLERGC